MPATGIEPMIADVLTITLQRMVLSTDLPLPSALQLKINKVPISNLIYLRQKKKKYISLVFFEQKKTPNLELWNLIYLCCVQ